MALNGFSPGWRLADEAGPLPPWQGCWGRKPGGPGSPPPRRLTRSTTFCQFFRCGATKEKIKREEKCSAQELTLNIILLYYHKILGILRYKEKYIPKKQSKSSDAFGIIHLKLLL